MSLAISAPVSGLPASAQACAALAIPAASSIQFPRLGEDRPYAVLNDARIHQSVLHEPSVSVTEVHGCVLRCGCVVISEQ